MTALSSLPHSLFQRHAQGRTFGTPFLRALAIAFSAVALAAPGSVVVNEIMYHPANDLDTLQYIELFNAGKAEADLSGWTLSKGVKFRFPADTKLAPGGFLVVCRNGADFVKQYGKDVPIAGDFSGHLSHNGEQVELSGADQQKIDAVRYADAAPWPASADGRSSSLERICPLAPGDDPSNWSASTFSEAMPLGGTPGRINDSFSAAVPPLIREVALQPAQPLAGSPVTVTTSVSSPTALKGVTLFFRVATETTFSVETALPMRRVSGNDKEGRYEAVLPAQPEQRLVRYRIEADNAADARRILPAPGELRKALSYSTFLNKNTGKIAWGIVLHPGDESLVSNPRSSRHPVTKMAPGRDAFIYLPAGNGDAQLFDFVRVSRRKGGIKIHFLKEQTLRGMTSINIISEGSPRWVLAEPLAYELYRMAGVPAEQTEHIRLWVDGKARGYQLLIEQPNKAFLARNGVKGGGNLYKYIWYRDNLIERHEKKTNLAGGHDDLVALVEGLNQTSGSKQWSFIQKQFNVEEFINYFAVNMCIQNWDGFHNNYFLYHDTEGSGRWEIYPWDEDKTWGDYDGASSRYDWYSMPLTFGMNGTQPPEALRSRVAQGGFVDWWREPGIFSGPLLANPFFRARFLERLEEVCRTVFTPEKLLPIIDEMEKRLEGEVRIRAESAGGSSALVIKRFRTDIESLRNQVTQRRDFLLLELRKLKP
ncbi:MAG: CotH kinase family protein [Verrucomicrobiota bacterium]